MTEPRATNLSHPVIDFLRQEADRTAGPFVDPVALGEIQHWWTPDLTPWASVIVGRPIDDLLRLPWRHLVLLQFAHQAEPDPPPSPAVAARRKWEAIKRAVDAKAADDAWAELHEALPVPIAVAHNHTSRPALDGNQQGADHIVLLEDLTDGHRHRPANRPLCTIPSRANYLQDLPQQDDPATRRANCRNCLYIAYRIVQRPPDPRLVRRREA